MKLNKVASLTLIVLACVVIALLLINSGPQEPDEVAESFAQALMRAAPKDAKSLTVAAQHERVASLVATATPFACRTALFRKEEEGFYWGAFSCSYLVGEEGSRQRCFVQYDCREDGRSFTVNDIELRVIEKEWRVYDWGKIEAKVR